MWLLLLFVALNIIAAFLGRHVFNFSAFELTPAAIAILVWNEYGVVVSSLFLSVSYAATGVKDLQYLWITLPGALLTGLVAMFIPNIFVCILFYHAVGAIANYVLYQYLDIRYVLFMMMNIAVNVVLGRIYGFFS
ncbi:hypothetical protein GOV07_00785 [Candidatus Woesearchaeota archaeon]|nr:hypothetical protein [Candidatus Woesearchaeota archaeon]